MHFPAGNHPSKTFPANQDAFLRWKSSLTDFSSKSGSISPLEIIPHRLFQQIRMHFSNGNHPSQTFPANQDAFPRWKSSLTDFSSKSGCISPPKIIPPGNFQQIRMHFPDANHPSRTFPADQDAFLRWKSSLPEIFSRSGCISPLEIISPGNFQQIRMHFSAGNHLSRKFPANQDAFLQRESSLPEIFSKSGCISPPEIIPPRHFQQIRMHFHTGNHPAGNHPAENHLAANHTLSHKKRLVRLIRQAECIQREIQ